MAEVNFFSTMNGSQNTSLQEDGQYCDIGSSPARNENNNVVANELDGKLGNGESNLGRNGSSPTQDGEVPQMKPTVDSVNQTSSKHSLDIPSDLGNDEDSKTQCSDSENQECNRQTLIPPNASSLALTNNCASENLTVGAHSAPSISTNTLPDATQSSKQKSGFPLPLNVSLVNSVTTSPYFTRSAKMAPLSSPVAHEATAAQSTTCSLVTSGTPSTSGLINASKPITTFAISLSESIQPAATIIISAPTAAQDVSQTTTVTSAGSSSTSSLVNSSKHVTTFASSLHQSNEPAATISAPTGALDVSQTTAVTSAAIGVPVSQMMTLPTIPAPLSNLVIKQDDPASSSSIPGHIVTPQMLMQALATCTLPMNVSATSTMARNSSTPLAIPSLANKVEDPQPTSVSNDMAAISSSSFPSTSNSTALVAVPVAMTKLDLEAPITASNATANVTQTTATANPCTDNVASGSMSIATSSTALPEIVTIFPDFTPCSKCNSILVCSCPGPSSIGDGSGAVSATCQAGCQGDCTCNEMKVKNQVDGLNPSEQDVKPQIFPVVVS